MYLTKGQLKLLTYIVAANKMQVSELADNIYYSKNREVSQKSCVKNVSN